MSYSVLGFPSPPNALDVSFLSSTPSNNNSSAKCDSNHVGMKATSEWYKWRLLISYDGTHYAGWQYQASPPTVQCHVEKALTRLTKLERKDLRLVAAGRTDSGVHAWGQVVHFMTPFNYESLEGVHRALNGGLPADIRVREMSPAVPEFHARFSAQSKTYHYKIYNDIVMDPFQHRFSFHSTFKLDASLMREAAKHFVGTHDFSAFANASHNDGVPNPVKAIFRFDVIEMVALLLQVGREAAPPNIVPKILAKRDRRELAKYTFFVPPHGLSLVNVKYKEDHLRLPLDGPKSSFGRHHTLRKCKVPFN